MWSYIAGGLKHRKLPFETKSSGLIIKGGLKIEGCKIEGLLYHLFFSAMEIGPVMCLSLFKIWAGVLEILKSKF